jgi:hypothetical protein
MTARQQAWYDWVAARGCLVPGCDKPASLHHIHGVRSFKTGQRLRRRQYLAEWAVIPVCRDHHQDSPRSIHNAGEEAFGVEFLGGSNAVLEWAYSLALRYAHEGRNG